MELIIIVTSLCITLSVFLKPSHSLQLIQVQSSHDQLAHGHQQLTLPALPRKLKLTEEASMKGYEGQDMVSYNTKKDHALSAGKAHHKEAKMIHSKGGTWREWTEGSDTSQFFTMDYSHVRRRRPIHNKSLPVAP